MNIECLGAKFEVKFAEKDAPLGSFEGYGAVFGNIDSHGDVIEPGAFKDCLDQRKAQGRGLPSMYKMHGGFLGMNRDPIGVWDAMSEDTKGLNVKGRLCGMDTEQGKFTYSQLKDGALQGLSIGYNVPSDGAKAGSGKKGEPSRYLKKVNLFEVSLVDDPSNAKSMVSAIKSRISPDFLAYAEEIKTIREFEIFLRDVGGFSHAAAKAIAAGGFKGKPEPRDEAGAGDAIRGVFDDLVKLIRK